MSQLKIKKKTFFPLQNQMLYASCTVKLNELNSKKNRSRIQMHLNSLFKQIILIVEAKMKIFQDIFSDEELISDSYKMVEVFDGVAVEIQSRMVVKGDVNVDVGCGNAFGGKNQEEEEGGAPANTQAVLKINDLIDAFGYEETGLDKEGYKAYFKEYMKKLKAYIQEKNPNRVAAFQKGALEFFKFVLAKFDDFTFYTGKSYDLDNSIVYSYYKKEDDEAPTFLYIMDGLKFYKV